MNAVFNYSYDDRLLFDATFRTNASSQFGANQRWGNFWSLGAGWNMHNEKWLRSKEWFSRLKLRASSEVRDHREIMPISLWLLIIIARKTMRISWGLFDGYGE